MKKIEKVLIITSIFIFLIFSSLLFIFFSNNVIEFDEIRFNKLGLNLANDNELTITGEIPYLGAHPIGYVFFLGFLYKIIPNPVLGNPP